MKSKGLKIPAIIIAIGIIVAIAAGLLVSMQKTPAVTNHDFDFSITSRTSFTPDDTALSVQKGRLRRLAMIFAIVVFPVPGGPHRIKESILPPSIIRRRTAPSPTRCSCPTKPSKSLGLKRSAKGRAIKQFLISSDAKLQSLSAQCKMMIENNQQQYMSHNIKLYSAFI